MSGHPSWLSGPLCVSEIGISPVPFFLRAILTYLSHWISSTCCSQRSRHDSPENKMYKKGLQSSTKCYQSLPGLAVLGKCRQVGDVCFVSEPISTLIDGIDWHVFRFKEEVQIFEQYSSTWSVVPYDQDVPGATKPSTYVSFVLRYRSPGIPSRNLSSWFLDWSFCSPSRRIASIPPHS